MYNGKCAKSMCVYVWGEKTTLTEQCEKDGEQVCRRQDKYQEEGEESQMEKVKKKVWE